MTVLKCVGEGASLVSLVVTILLPISGDARDKCVRSLGQEGPLAEEMATHSSILAWDIPWQLQSIGLQRVIDMTE